jgi:hypothetical protein
MTAAYSALEVLFTVLQVGPVTVLAVRFRLGKHWLPAPSASSDTKVSINTFVQ